MQRKHLAAVAAAVALAGTALSAPAVATDPSAKPKASTLAKGLVSPLTLAVSDDGTVYYAQNFAGTLHAKKPGKKPRTIYTAPVPGTEVGAVSERQGSLRFALTLPTEEGVPPQTVLMGVGNNGKARPLADLSKYEETKNPDAKIRYGFRSLPAECEVPPFLSNTPGIVESHPYATTQVNGATFVADAAGNTILKLGKGGKLSTLAVLPAQPLKIDQNVIDVIKETMELELPACTIGQTAYFESVPTDVERGRDGKLYVTTLPGGPEDPRLGARGAVYRVDPKSGRTTRVAGGLISPTGVAVDARGTLFVAELFGGRIAKIKKGAKTPSGFFKTMMPGDVEVRRNGDLYATNQALIGDEVTPPGGQVIRIKR